MAEFIEFNVPFGLRGKRRGRSARRHLAALLPTVAQLFRPDNVLCSRDVFVGRAFSAIHWVSSPVPLSYQPKTPPTTPSKTRKGVLLPLSSAEFKQDVGEQYGSGRSSWRTPKLGRPLGLRHTI